MAAEETDEDARRLKHVAENAHNAANVDRDFGLMVADVLEMVANGMAWETIIEEWRGALTKEAIAEAIRLAREALLTHGDELVLELAGG